jgi:multidrug efflux pump subunit AcrA (membrane-fusion protein)
MTRKTLVRSAGLLLTAVALSLLGCANNPTVPLPPPDVTVITTTSPDLDGFVTVTGASEAAQPDSIVLLFNEETESGVMETADIDGSFVAVIAAQTGNVLSLQYKVDDLLSRTEFIVVE